MEGINKYCVDVVGILEVSLPSIFIDKNNEYDHCEYCPDTDELVIVDPEGSRESYFHAAHELRHKWQYVKQYDRYFRDYKELDEVSLHNYRMQKAEVDANAFGILMMIKFFNDISFLNGYLDDEKKAIYDRAKEISKHFGLKDVSWEQVYKAVGIC